jgi:hypothetical protein
VTTFAFTLDVIVQADDEAEARELREQALAAVVAKSEFYPSLLSVEVGELRRVEDRRVTA